MKSRIKPELKTVIYEQPGEISKLKSEKVFRNLLKLHQAHPELYKEYQAMKAKQAQTKSA